MSRSHTYRPLLTALACILWVTAPTASAEPRPGESGATPAEMPPWTLPPAAAGPVQRAVETPDGRLLDGRLVLQSAALDRDHVVVRYGDQLDGPTRFGATLRHPTQAREGWTLTTAFAVDPEPGPTDNAALAALGARLAPLDPSRLWVAAPAASGPDDEHPDRAALGEARQQLERARQHGRFGEHGAAIEVLEGLTTDRATRALLGLDLVEAWWRAGDRERAVNTLSKWRMERTRPPGPVEAWRAKALLGDPLDGKALLEGLSESRSLCQAHVIAEAHDALGRRDDGYSLLFRALRLSDDCLELAAEVLRWQLEDARIDDADALSARLLERYPDAAEIRNPRAQVKMAQGKPIEAVELLEPVAWSDPHSGAVSSLLGAYQRIEDPAWRDAKLAELIRLADAPGAPDVAAFYAGVQLHYRGEWERSNTYLNRVAETFGGQPRLHIYLGMNAFNLGDPETAMRRITEAEALDAPDPDVYYCRAELHRWTDPAAAAADLRRYLAQTEGSPTALAKKQARVRRMLELLDVCVATKAPIPCVGPWEHPRGHAANVDPGGPPDGDGACGLAAARQQETPPAPRVWPWAGLGGLLVAAGLGWWGLVRRRRTT